MLFAQICFQPTVASAWVVPQTGTSGCMSHAFWYRAIDVELEKDVHPRAWRRSATCPNWSSLYLYKMSCLSISTENDVVILADKDLTYHCNSEISDKPICNLNIDVLVVLILNMNGMQTSKGRSGTAGRDLSSSELSS